jgi:hypothetical protein
LKVTGEVIDMLDVGFIALTILFFTLSVGYVAACDRLMK